MQLWYSTRNNQFWLYNPETSTSYFVAVNDNSALAEGSIYYSVQPYWDKLLTGLGWTDNDEFNHSKFIFESSEFDEVIAQLIRVRGYL